MPEVSDVSRPLDRIQDGDAAASVKIVPCLHEKLIATRCRKSDRRGRMLQPTALVHEAFLELVDTKNADYPLRGHAIGNADPVLSQLGRASLISF